MILKNFKCKPVVVISKSVVNSFWLLTIGYWLMALSSCYSFKDVSIEPEAKTVRISYIDNRARIINPNLSQRLTDKLRQKVINQTCLSQKNSYEAHYDIS